MFLPIKQLIENMKADESNLSQTRKNALAHLADTLVEKKTGDDLQLMFICTHNSRRSIFAQVWASVLADHYQLPIKAFSGGTEATAVHENTLKCLDDLGFEIASGNDRQNEKVQIKYGKHQQISCYSKVFDHPENPQQDFIALMLCDHAAEHCPFIPNASARLNFTFPDPKKYDGTVFKSDKYKEICLDIAIQLDLIFRGFINGGSGPKRG